MTKPLYLQVPHMTVPDIVNPFLPWIEEDQMTCRQVAILLLLRANPGVSTGAVASALNLNTPCVTRAVDKLELLGLITRTVHRDDRRLVRLYARNTKSKKKSVA